MEGKEIKPKATGYDKYINWKVFSIPLGLLILLLIMPTPKSMLDVGVEYSMGAHYVQDFFAGELFNKPSTELSQWEIQLVRMMEVSVAKASFSKEAFIKKNAKWCKKNEIPSTRKHLEQVMAYVEEIPPDGLCRRDTPGYVSETIRTGAYLKGR
ncbi:MAG: hypothetical protein JRI43_09015 [Deltaproteobacteria bacterium]|nr:hypothetical protein [Deltaproteobacteria bacterium]